MKKKKKIRLLNEAWFLYRKKKIYFKTMMLIFVLSISNGYHNLKICLSHFLVFEDDKSKAAHNLR